MEFHPEPHIPNCCRTDAALAWDARNYRTGAFAELEKRNAVDESSSAGCRSRVTRTGCDEIVMLDGWNDLFIARSNMRAVDRVVYHGFRARAEADPPA